LEGTNAPPVAGPTETVGTGIALHIALFGGEGLQGPVHALSLSRLRVAAVAESLRAADDIQGALCQVVLVGGQGHALKRTDAFRFDAYEVAIASQKFHLKAVGDEFCAALVAVGVGDRGLALVLVVRSADIAEGTGPKVVALAFPTKASERGLSVHAEVHLAIRPVKGDKAVAFSGDLIVRETILTVRKYGSPKAGHGGVEKISRPEAREQEERKDNDLLHLAGGLCLCLHLCS